MLGWCWLPFLAELVEAKRGERDKQAPVGGSLVENND